MRRYLIASIIVSAMLLYVLTYTVYAIKHEASITYPEGTFKCEKIK